MKTVALRGSMRLVLAALAALAWSAGSRAETAAKPGAATPPQSATSPRLYAADCGSIHIGVRQPRFGRVYGLCRNQRALLARIDACVRLVVAKKEERGQRSLRFDYALPDAAHQSGLSQYELLTTLGSRFARRWV